MNDRALNSPSPTRSSSSAPRPASPSRPRRGRRRLGDPAGADIYALSSSKGLFGGVAIQGGAIGPTRIWNAAYYGRPVTTEAIVYGRAKLRQPGANALRRALGRL